MDEFQQAAVPVVTGPAGVAMAGNVVVGLSGTAVGGPSPGEVPDPLPAELELVPYADALAARHFPETEDQAEEARRRLAFDELVTLQLAVSRLRQTAAVAPALAAPGELAGRYRTVLPFTLTISGDQAAAKGHLSLIRSDFGIGQGPWSSGQWVALEVGVDVDLVATKSGS